MQLEEANEALAMRKSPSLVITPMKTAEPVTPVTPPETERVSFTPRAFSFIHVIDQMNHLMHMIT